MSITTAKHLGLPQRTPSPNDEYPRKVASDAYQELVRVWKEHIIKLIKARPLKVFIDSLPKQNKGDIYGYVDELQDTGINYDTQCDFEWICYCQAQLQALTSMYPEHEDVWFEAWGQ